jgi:hypothetical protein
VILTHRHIPYMVRIKIMERALKAMRFKPYVIVGARFRYYIATPVLYDVRLWQIQKKKFVNNRSAGCWSNFNSLSGHFPIIEMSFFFSNDLVVFVAFSSNQDKVTFMSQSNGRLDGFPPVQLKDVPRSGQIFI